MSAEVTTRAPRRYLAWCAQCADGVKSHSLSKAQTWVETHNTTNHKETK